MLKNTSIGRFYSGLRQTSAAVTALQFRADRLEQEVQDVRQMAELRQALDAAEKRIADLETLLEERSSTLSSQVAERTAGVDLRVDSLSDRLAGLKRDVAAEQALVTRSYADISRRVDLLRRQQPAVAPGETAADPARQAEGLQSLIDAFYNRLEDRYRGSREEIKRRLLKYIPDAESAAQRCGGLPALDIGCGRGEWLELLAEHGLKGIGVDLNPVQIEEARAVDLDVHQDDAVAWLGRAADASFSMITAHHLVEHLPFDTVVWIAREAMRVLAPGGVLLFETPNPRNILVSTTGFHMDPTHIRPLPAEVLSTLFDTIGFHPVESRFLHAHARLPEFLEGKRLDPEVATLFFGPQDHAVLGIRPTVGE
ncbi:MAG: methyltransferase domain-containing protein [Rhizobiaceae bacterium]|nr:methyltransferase domain-containing protein [Rhizobiaceae bacterium]